MQNDLLKKSRGLLGSFSQTAQNGPGPHILRDRSSYQQKPARPCFGHRASQPVCVTQSDCSRVRWLDWENDYPLARAYWPQDPPLERVDWEQNRADGFRYCAIVEQEAIAALAAVWTYSETHWEVAAVSTAPASRKKGNGKAVVCFVTAHILEHGRKATLLTESTNAAMLKTAESVGFYRSAERGRAKSEAPNM